ncbi:MAG: hypothetical protein WKF96_19765, partial [Solirubrobacteraceae bacterium]
TGSRDPIVVLGVGWAAGIALEVLGVVLTAALGVRSLAPVLPLALAGAAWWPARRTRLRWPAPRPAPWAAFAVAGAGVAVLSLSVGWLFPSTPLPGVVTSITYDHDTLFYLGIAADALHHWPPTNPSIAGLDLPYHLWAFARQAGEARATGIDLPVVAFRLDTSTTAMALVLAVAALARTAGAGAFGSGLAALLAIAVGEIDLHPNEPFPFRGLLLQELALDPSTGVALVLFTGAATALWHVVRDPRHWGGIALAALLLFGAVGAKAPTVPVLLGGTLVFGAWHLLHRRRPGRGLVIAAALSGIALTLGFLLLYAGATNGTLAFAPLAAFEQMRLVEALRSAGESGQIPGWSMIPGALQSVVLGVIGLAGLAATQLAAAALGRRGLGAAGDERGAMDSWLAALTVAGALPFLLFTLGGDEVYFVLFGLLAGGVLAAVRFERHAWCAVGGAGRRRLAAAGAGATAIGLVAAWWIDERGAELTLSVRPTAIAIAAALAVAVGLWRLRSSGAQLGALACAALMGLGLLDGVLDTVPRGIEAARSGTPVYETGGRGLDDGLLAGLSWVREQTPRRSIIAVNNHFIDDEGSDPRAFQYSAFTQRRVYLQSWLYTPGAFRVGRERVLHDGLQPYPTRANINAAAFAGAPGPLRQLRRAGVTHLVVDRRYGPPITGRLRRVGPPAFSNASVMIFAL